MIRAYKTDDRILSEVAYSPSAKGNWLKIVNPTDAEVAKLAKDFKIEPDDLRAALDEEEGARVDVNRRYTLILFDIPVSEERHDTKLYKTIPLGIVLTDSAILTICKSNTQIVDFFTSKRETGDFSTKKKMRFIYQIFLRAAMIYQNDLHLLDKRRLEIEKRVDGEIRDKDLIELQELESTYVYFETSLRAGLTVLDRLRRYEKIEQYAEDVELLDDVLVEYNQAVEMTMIYRNIIDGTRSLLSSILDSRLNNVMKYLTSITFVMAIPTVISGLYGMNVNAEGMPFANSPLGFAIVCSVTVLICVVVLWVLKKKKLL